MNVVVHTSDKRHQCWDDEVEQVFRGSHGGHGLFWSLLVYVLGWRWDSVPRRRDCQTLTRHWVYLAASRFPSPCCIAFGLIVSMPVCLPNRRIFRTLGRLLPIPNLWQFRCKGKRHPRLKQVWQRPGPATSKGVELSIPWRLRPYPRQPPEESPSESRARPGDSTAFSPPGIPTMEQTLPDSLRTPGLELPPQG